MAYATADDMTARFGLDEMVQLTDDAATGEIGPRLGIALADAGQMVNGYAAASYVVPLDPVPDLVARWTCDIARYFLHRDGAPELVVQNYRDALAGLRDVARGNLTLECAGIEAPSADGQDDLATFDPPARVMDAFPGGV